MIWNETKECMSREDMKNLQSARLRKLVDYVYHNVEFYRKKMQAVGLMPADIKGIEDIEKLPFTTKDDLRENYPFGLFAVPQSEIVRIHASSGTTGKATVVGYTRYDLDIWSECVARCMTMAGVGRDDIIQVAYGYGLFTGGLGAHSGSEKIGATVVPMSIIRLFFVSPDIFRFFRRINPDYFRYKSGIFDFCFCRCCFLQNKHFRYLP